MSLIFLLVCLPPTFIFYCRTKKVLSDLCLISTETVNEACNALWNASSLFNAINYLSANQIAEVLKFSFVLSTRKLELERALARAQN